MQNYQLSPIAIILLLGSAAALIFSINQFGSGQKRGQSAVPAAFEQVLPPPKSERLYNNQHSKSRPLFHPSRRVVASSAPDTTVTTPEFEPDSLQVEAIIGGRSHLSAGLRTSPNAPLQWVEEGQNLQDWSVVKIGLETVKLSNGISELELSLYPSSDRVVGN